MGSLVPNWILSLTFLHNLEDAYKSFVSLTLQNIQGTEPDLNTIISQLLNKEQQQVNFSKTTALLTKMRNTYCNHCKHSNYSKANCWRLHLEKAPHWGKDNTLRKDKNKKNKKDKNKEKTGEVFIKTSLLLPARANSWFIDSGATQHMCINQDAFTNYINGNSTIFLGDSTPTKAKGQRHVTMQLQGSIPITFTNILHVLFLSINLLFVLALFSKGCKFHFEKGSCSIYCPNGTHLKTGIQERNLFCFFMTNHALVTTGSPPKLPIELWHQRLGHLGLENIKRLQDHFTGIHLDKTNILTVCKSCLARKQHRTPSHQPPQRAKERLKLIYLDVKGLITPSSARGARY